MGIKKKIVLWYTLWMAVLCALLLYTVFRSSDFLLSSEVREDLVEAVADAVEDYSESRGRKMDIYDDGVFIIAYSPSGDIVKGTEPDGLPVLAYNGGRISTYTSGNLDWYVYDYMLEDGSFIRGAYPVMGLSGFFSSVFLAALVFLPLMVALAAVGGYFITKGAFRPLERMIATANGIAVGTDLSKRMDIDRASVEIKELADTFDKMLSRLEVSFKKEMQFTSDASHELRTPVAVIRAQAEYALSHTSEEESREALEEIIAQVDRMMRLLDQLLSLARADGGTVKLHFEQINLGELAQVTVASMEERAGDKGVSLYFDGEADLMANVDETLMARLFINLLDNGICYTDEGGFVRLSLHRAGGNVVITVSDNGIGIPADKIERIWDRFYQVDPSRSRRGNSGLGLPMVKWIASVHDGSCSVESIPGVGSRFTVTIKG